MNPDFDYLLWARSDERHDVTLTAHLAGPHADLRDGRPCCRGQALAYVITVTAGFATRKLSEIPL